MTALAELLAMVEGLEEHPDDYQSVRAMKRLAHTVKQDVKA